MGQLQKINPELVKLGYQIVAISPDRPEKVRAIADGKKLDYTLLSDAKMAAALALGVAYRVDPETVEKLAGFGVDLAESSGEKHGLLPVPSVFVLTEDGTIAFEHVDPDYTVRLDPDVLLAAAAAALK